MPNDQMRVRPVSVWDPDEVEKPTQFRRLLLYYLRFSQLALPLTIAKNWTARPWRNVSLLFVNLSIANSSSLQLKAGKGPANVPMFRRDGWPSLAEWGLCTPIGMPTNGYHGDTDEMLRRQPPAYSVQMVYIHPPATLTAVLYDRIQPSNMIPLNRPPPY